GRLARRGRNGHQRAVRVAGTGRLARGSALLATVRAGQSARTQTRGRRSQETRHPTALAVRLADLRPRRLLPTRDTRTTTAGRGPPQSWAGAAPVDVGRRARDRRHKNVSL